MTKHGMCNTKGLKCIKSPSSKPNWREWGREGQGENTNLLLGVVAATCSLGTFANAGEWLDPPGIVPLTAVPKCIQVRTCRAYCPKRAPSPKGDGIRSRLFMKAMDRADGVLASLSLGTCVRNVDSPVSCLLPEPSILLFSWTCAHGAPHAIASKKKRKE